MANNVSPNVQSAVSFLRDPSVQDAPLNKKLEFLQAKGLSQTEIDTAFRLASSGSPSTSSASFTSQSAAPGYRPYGYPAPSMMAQDRMRPDWRDWFIMAVVSGGVGTLAYSLARKYLFPALKPPTETELTTAQDALTAKYDEAAAILASLQEETTEIKQSLNEQCELVDSVVGQVNETLNTIKDKETERDEELKSMREEVDALKGLIERMFDKHKDAQSESLKDIEGEVKSLKSLLARRPGGGEGPGISRSVSPSQSNLSAAAQSYQPGATSGSTGGYTSSPSRFGLSSSSSAGGMSPSSSFANILNRPPGIPAWQMQQQAQQSSTAPASAPTAASSSASNTSSSTAHATPAASSELSKTASASSASSSAEDGAVSQAGSKEDGGYVVGETPVNRANGLEESGEIVPSVNDVAI